MNNNSIILLEKHKIIWTKIEYLLELNALPVYDDRYIKTKIRTHVYTNFCGLNVAEDGVKCESFTIICDYSLLVCKSKCYLQVYFNNCVYKIVDREIVDYLHDNLFDSEGNQVLRY